MRTIFHSLRVRLIAGFALVIVLSFALAGAGAVWLLRDQQAVAAQDRFGRLVDPLSQWVLRMELAQMPAERIASELRAYAAYEDIRILLLDQQNHVVLDTTQRSGLLGEVIPGLGEVMQPTDHDEREDLAVYRTVRFADGGDDYILFAPARRATVPAGWPFDVGPIALVVAVPAQHVSAAWAALLPRLLEAGTIAALFGVAVAWLLADRVTRPLSEMRLASEAMARGDYEQRVDVDGDDEVAQLGEAFNTMAQQVARSHRSMRQLIGDVSHELMTPLTSIQGYAQAMLDGVAGTPEESRQLASVVHEEADRMRLLVEDLLYLSRLESGELRLTMDIVELDPIVGTAEQRFRFQAQAADVAIVLDLHGGAVIADARRIEQVLANLLENAVRHAPPGSAVTVRTTVMGQYTTIAVHNAGPPIPPADLPHVFDRFYQADPARSRLGSTGHAGLGLAIVQEIVRAHGGEVAAASSAETGTTFTVRIPRDAEAARRPRAAERSIEGGRA